MHQKEVENLSMKAKTRRRKIQQVFVLCQCQSVSVIIHFIISFLFPEVSPLRYWCQCYKTFF
jgi:hypothetical protein